jgi:hypothetical protein
MSVSFWFVAHHSFRKFKHSQAKRTRKHMENMKEKRRRKKRGEEVSPLSLTPTLTPTGYETSPGRREIEPLSEG